MAPYQQNEALDALDQILTPSNHAFAHRHETELLCVLEQGLTGRETTISENTGLEVHTDRRTQLPFNGQFVFFIVLEGELYVFVMSNDKQSFAVYELQSLTALALYQLQAPLPENAILDRVVFPDVSTIQLTYWIGDDETTRTFGFSEID